MDTAITFPGMGPNRFHDLAKFLLVDPSTRAMLATADDVLGYSLFDRCLADDDDYSEYAQVAFLIACLGMAKWAEEEFGARPEVCVGLSFGGKTAAVYSGALDFADAVGLTVAMARAEQEYFAHEHRDVVTHSFTRVPADVLAGILGELDRRGEWYEISCYVDEDFHMVSLRDHALEDFQRRLRAVGGMSFYTMRPPLHCAAFAPLRDRVERDVLAGIDFADPRVPVVADQDGRVLTTAEGVRTMLLDGIVRPVRWPAAIATLQGLGVRTLHVAGPDAVFGRVRAARSAFEVVPANLDRVLRPRTRGMAAASA